MMGLFGKKKIEGKTAEEWFELAHSEKNLEKQIDYYTKCLELDPNNLDAWHNKGFALAVLKKYEKAIRCYDKALGINPKTVGVWNK